MEGQGAGLDAKGGRYRPNRQRISLSERSMMRVHGSRRAQDSFSQIDISALLGLALQPGQPPPGHPCNVESK